MKPRPLAALALGLAILLATPSASFADATSTPKPKPTSTSKPKPTPTPKPMSMSELDFEEAINQYEIAVDEFRAEMKEREKTRKKITREFMAAVSAANRTAKTAMRNAKTVDAKSVALARQKSSVVLAALARDAAITAMGPVPLEPEEIAPMKKEKPDKPKPTPKK